jgi:low temperature requirement protein LtrA
MELFFDLVYVFAVTQLAEFLLTHLSIGGALETLLLLIAIWRAWVDTAWVTNWFDPDQSRVRLMLVGVMLLSMLMSAALPLAFSTHGLIFAAAYVAIQLGRTAFVVVALPRESRLGRNFQRILAWFALSGVLWLAGGLLGGVAREALWFGAVAADAAAPAVGFITPGLGRSGPADWMISGTHLAERCELFLIVALGELILSIGATLARQPLSLGRAAAFLVAFVGAVTLWWIYFDRSAQWASRLIEAAREPGRLGRSAYT